MIRATAVALSFAALSSGAAGAQELQSCDSSAANAQFLKMPVEESVRSFAQGAITMIELDTFGEPACCSAYVMIVYPSPDDPFPRCLLLTQGNQLGYLSTALNRARAAYDPARGLTVDLPVESYAETGPLPGTVRLTVNQADGTVTAE